ncbi:hypothetical protein L211DRAFT_850392 [Terfezia boudieri ATCC MYA-4762]|uniref:Uncharacterized protein n=1 Tax=Terfezia boudieri ATCC MYA-4762 TaxID=1051890 RepID=A0A3N4LPM9_9PEZI|nr:hypothetical protein L211DRAFT_850392 [Terfezia boudieri ATCC MYA-4762]
MSHSPIAASSSASCEAFTRSQNEGSAQSTPPGPGYLSPLKSSQANIIQAAVSTPAKYISLNAQPDVSLHTKFSGFSVRPLYSSPATPTSSGSVTESSPSRPSSSITTLGTAQPVSFSTLSNKRTVFLSKHMRSKSSHFPGMMSPPPSPLSAITPNSPTTSRMQLLRSTSLPTVPQYERAREKFIPTLGPPPSPSPINTNTSSWRNGMSIPTPSEGTRNYRMRERSPSRRSTSSSGYYSTSPKASFYYPPHHQSPRELRWGEDSYASSIASSSPSLCSSGPSTPSSIRSRSPSISSLETIPDSPDAEAEALEAERLAEEARRLAIAEEEEEEPEPESIGMTRSVSSPISERSLRRRSHVGLEGISGLMIPPARAGNTGLTAEEKRRKRWSVCGGEKRADLELETIWEDRVVAVQSPPQRSLVGIVGSAEYEVYERGNGFGEEMI